MERKRRIPKQVTTMEQNNEYLHKMFGMMREIQDAMVMQQNETFNSTEIRLMNEVVYAQAKGERLISTRLADRLGITRSAVSQIVGKLEECGAVRRVPDAVDRKIAYVELTEEIQEKYKDVVNEYVNFVGMIIARMGVNKMDRFLALANEFYGAVEEAVKDREASK
jgi:DNA-binding MarR family transcriptional regulator